MRLSIPIYTVDHERIRHLREMHELVTHVLRVHTKARDQVNFVDVDGNDILQRRC
jgi:hypothetical protein